VTVVGSGLVFGMMLSYGFLFVVAFVVRVVKTCGVVL